MPESSPFPPLGEFISSQAEEGFNPQEIDAALKSHFGFGLKDVPKAENARRYAIQTTGIDPLSRGFEQMIAKHQPQQPEPASVPLPTTGQPEGVPTAAEAAKDEPFEDKGFWQGMGETALTALGGLPAMAFGAAKGVAPAHSGPVDVSGQFAGRPHPADMAAQERGRGVVSQPEAIARLGAAGRAYKGYEELMKEREDMPFALASIRSIGDMFAGGLEIGAKVLGISPTGAENLPWPRSVIEGIQKRFHEGEEIAGGMVGGTAAMATGLAKDVGSFARGEAPTGPMHGDFPAVAAALAAPIAKGGAAALGRVAQTEGRMGAVAKTLQKPAKKGHQPVETIWEHLEDPINAKTDKQFFDRMVEEGIMTPEEAGVAMDEMHPMRPRQTAEPIEGGVRTAERTALEGARNAFVGWAMTGDLVGAPAAALLGAALPEVLAAAWGKLSPQSRAWFLRRWRSASEQVSEPLTEIAEDAQAREVRSEVQNLVNEQASRVGTGEVGFQKLPDDFDTLPAAQQKAIKAKMTAPRPATTSPVLEPHFIGDKAEFRPPAEAAEASAAQRVPVMEASGEVARTRAAKKATQRKAMQAGEEAVEWQAASEGARKVAKEARDKRAELGDQRALDVEAGLVEMGGPKKVTRQKGRAAVQQYRGDPPEGPLVGGREEGFRPPSDFDQYKEAYARGVYLDTDAATAASRRAIAPSRRQWGALGDSVSKRDYNLRPGKTLDLNTEAGLAELREVQKAALDAKGDWQTALTDDLKSRGYRYVEGGGYMGEVGEVIALYPDDVRAPVVTYPGDRVPIRTTDKHVEALIDRVEEAGNRMMPPGRGLPRKWYARALTDAMLDDGLTSLRDPRMRGMLAERMAREIGDPKLAKQLQIALDEKFSQLMEHALGPEPAGLVLKIGDKRFNAQDMLRHLKETMDPAMRAEMEAGALRRVATHLGLQVEAAHVAQSVMNQVNRFRVPIEGGQHRTVPAVEVASRVLNTNEPSPLITTFDAATVNPKAPGMGDIILANPEAFAAEVGAAGGKPVTLQQVIDLGKHFQEDYITMPAEIRAFLDEAAVRGDIPRLPQGPLQIRKGFAETMGSHIEVLNAMKQAHSFVNMMTRRAKLGLTAFRIGTHINNITSNLVYQGLRLGMDPLSVAFEWAKTGREWVRFLREPQAFTGADLMMRRGIGKTGVVDTHAIEPEMQSMGFAPAGMGRARAFLKKAGQKAQRAYRAGDAIPKLHDAERTFRYIDDKLQQLGEGMWIEMDFGKGRKIRLTKGQNGVLTAGSKTYRPGTQAYADVVAKVAVKPGLDIFFDYGDLPLYHKKLRGIAIVGAGSPFFSWTWKAMDLPGKKGLVGHLYDFDGGAMLRSNDPKINMGQAEAAAKMGAKRLAVINMNRAALDPRREGLRPLLGHNPREQGLVNIISGSNPLNQEIKSWGNQSMFGPTEAVWRLGHEGMSSILGGDWLEHVPIGKARDERVKIIQRMFGHEGGHTSRRAKRLRNLWVKKQAGELSSLRDSLQIVGMGGGLLQNFFSEAERAEKAGQQARFGRLFLDFTSMVMGATPTTMLIDIPAGMWDPSSPLTTRRQEFDGGVPNLESLGRHMVRKLLGAGYSRAALTGKKHRGAYKYGIADRYLERAEKELKASIEGSTKARGEFLKRQMAGAKTPEDRAKWDQLWTENNDRYIKLRQIVNEVTRELKTEIKENTLPFLEGE